MRQSKDRKDSGRRGIEAFFEEQAEIRNRNTLLLLLNSDRATHTVTGIRLTAHSRKRVTNLVVTVKSASLRLGLLEPVSTEMPFDDYIHRCKDEIAEINRCFSLVRLVPTVALAANGRSLNVQERLYVDPSLLGKSVAEHGWKIGGTDLNLLEAQAILGLSSLLKQHAIGSLRRCECGDWFIATRSDQASCSSTCRQRKHAASPGFNSKRREWYQTNKQRLANKRKREAKNAKAAK